MGYTDRVPTVHSTSVSEELTGTLLWDMRQFMFTPTGAHSGGQLEGKVEGRILWLE